MILRWLRRYSERATIASFDEGGSPERVTNHN